MQALTQFENFQRLPNENIDVMLTRFERLKWLAERDARYAQSFEVLTNKLFSILKIPADEQLKLMEPYGEVYPSTEEQFDQLKNKLRRRLRVLEHMPNNIIDLQRGRVRPGLGPGVRGHG